MIYKSDTKPFSEKGDERVRERERERERETWGLRMGDQDEKTTTSKSARGGLEEPKRRLIWKFKDGL